MRAVVGRFASRCRLLGEVETKLDEFEVPVAEFAPEELVDGVGGFVEAVVGEGAVDFGGDGVEAVEDPAGFEWGVGRGVWRPTQASERCLGTRIGGGFRASIGDLVIAGFVWRGRCS